MSDSFTASAWCNGLRRKNPVYGLRFGIEGRTYIEGKPEHIRIKLAGLAPIDVRLSEGFWKKCPEVRHPLIGDWFRKQGLALPWRAGCPYRFLVVKDGRHSFSITLAA